jgi:hypothetical protein
MDFSGGSATSTSGGASGGSVWIFTETADVTGMYLYLIYKMLYIKQESFPFKAGKRVPFHVHFN